LSEADPDFLKIGDLLLLLALKRRGSITEFSSENISLTVNESLVLVDHEVYITLIAGNIIFIMGSHI
jgi:hypothetical protein